MGGDDAFFELFIYDYVTKQIVDHIIKKTDNESYSNSIIYEI